MNRVVELFGHFTEEQESDWQKIVDEQQCPFLSRRCYKIRKSDPNTSIGTCTVLYGTPAEPIIICPTRLIDRRQIFLDCLHLLTNHEPGNELHIVPEVSIPGGSVDYFIVSTKANKVRDFVGVELQSLDTTGTVWPERQRLLRTLNVPRKDAAETITSTFGMNWKMTAKTILVQMHHKVQTFEHVNKKLALIIQDKFLNYMSREFNFAHLNHPTSIGDSIHLHAYQMERQSDNSLKLLLQSRLSTDAAGIALCLGLQTEARVELQQLFAYLEARISPITLFTPL